ncbi:MAG: hypothetical protein M8467_01535 [Anaerolineae bacterium]|nr:hypothetical protein [Anaerolineae bacterium]
MGVQESGLQGFLGLLINLGLPALVWATVTTGLILIVREKAEEAPTRHSTAGAEGIRAGCVSREEYQPCEVPGEAEQMISIPQFLCQG